jgi:serine/threonine protein kinase
MQVCAFSYCYYNLADNVSRDRAKVTEYACNTCGKFMYHSEFCKKLDKDHQKTCQAKNQPAGGKQVQKVPVKKAVPVQQIDIADKENRAPITNQAEVPQHRRSSTKLQILDKKKAKPASILRLYNYELNLSKMLGEGSYGKVVSGREILTNIEVAVKIVSKDFLASNSQAVLLKREIFIQRKLHHQNILELRDVFEDESNIYLVLEYCSGGTLFDYIQLKKGLSEKEAFVLFLQVCLAVETLHLNNIVHRDIKPENLLLDKACNLKLCDFGCSFQFLKNTPKVRKTYCGTIDYMAPEFFKKEPHSMAVDVWALGILLFEIVHARPPFDLEEEGQKIDTILNCEEQEFFYREGISKEFQDMMNMILRCSPKDRPKFDDIFGHAWIKKFAKKMNIDIERIRFKHSILDNYESADVQDFLAQCSLRPTEVIMFADTTYLEKLQEDDYDDSLQSGSRLLDINLAYEDSRSGKPPKSAGSFVGNSQMNILHMIDVKTVSNSEASDLNKEAKKTPITHEAWAQTSLVYSATKNSENHQPAIRETECVQRRVTKREVQASSFLTRKTDTNKADSGINAENNKKLDIVVLSNILVEESKDRRPKIQTPKISPKDTVKRSPSLFLKRGTAGMRSSRRAESTKPEDRGVKKSNNSQSSSRSFIGAVMNMFGCTPANDDQS